MADLTFRVIAPQRGTPGWLRRWLLAPPPGPTIGRKRRARRARGRWIEVKHRRSRPLTVEQWAAGHCMDAVAYGLGPCRHISVGYAGLPSERREADHEADQDGR
jgi:hypothetical protein